MGVKFKLEPVQEKNVKQSKLVEAGEDDGVCEDYSERNQRLQELYNRLWTAADELRANSRLGSTEYSTPVLGLLFLRFADYKFSIVEEELNRKQSSGRRSIGKADYQAKGVLFLVPEARYQRLLDLPEGANVGHAIDDAMRFIERENEGLKDVLPKDYEGMERRVLISLLRIFNFDISGYEGDVFGKIYEYFLGKFAMSEGQLAGEYFTPTSIVKLIVNVLEPFSGRILDPACGSGGMFVQSAEFVKEHRKSTTDISIYGQELKDKHVRLSKMNLAVHGLSGDIRQGNTYYEDVYDSLGLFDYVMANPPFNVNNVDKEAIKGDSRYPLGIPSVNNANYLWIQVFYSMLNKTGRAGFVMANSASDARYSEFEIRRKLIQKGIVDVIISVTSNFFYTVTLPVTLWFLNRGKRNTEHMDKILFIDARNIYTPIDRAHNEFSPQQIEFISNIVRFYRGQEIETTKCSLEMTKINFPELKYQDVKGLCKIVTIEEIKDQEWSINPGRYVGIKDIKDRGFDFHIQLTTLLEELNELISKSNDLEEKIIENTSSLLKNPG